MAFHISQDKTTYFLVGLPKCETPDYTYRDTKNAAMQDKLKREMRKLEKERRNPLLDSLQGSENTCLCVRKALLYQIPLLRTFYVFLECRKSNV